MPDAPTQTPPAPAQTPASSTPSPAQTPPPPSQTPPPAEPAKPAATPPPVTGEPAKPETDQTKGPARGPDGKFAPKSDATAAEPAKPAAPAPVDDAWKPDIPEKLPEGVKVDEARIARFKALAKEAGLPAALAQKLVEFDIAERGQEIESLRAMVQKNRADDLQKIKGDPVFGGAHYEETLRGSKSILSALKMGPAMSKKLELYGLDCDPDFVRGFAEIRSLIAEDSTASRISNTAPGVNAAPRSQLDRQAAVYDKKNKRA